MSKGALFVTNTDPLAIDLSLAVLIPSRGRAVELLETVESILKQSVQPALIILSVTCEDDFIAEIRDLPRVKLVVGPTGKTSQLNRGVKALGSDIDVIAIMDDDVELLRDYLKMIRDIFRRYPDLMGLTGQMVVNGGLDRAQARRMAEKEFSSPVEEKAAEVFWLKPNQGLYGCCMALRHSLFDHIQYDERLPLYSWMDDADIGMRAQRYGRCCYYPDAGLIHLGVNGGRVSGVRFGFCQIMNPVYLASERVFNWPDVIRIHVVKVLLANLLGWLRRDSKVDRAGRLRGNWLALLSWLQGRIEPERILEIH
jgi:GT2 family glycosyltransferase